ncbi:MAG: ABC transporter permease [Firmicutes bacterium]|jgi:hypothetical protein|nr:ABC transporter permease [Bacillota bacterium]
MTRWLALIRKEIQASWGPTAVAAALIVALDTWLIARTTAWRIRYPGLSFGLAMVPLAVLMVWTIWAGYLAVRSEWHGRTSMRLMSFPVSGRTVLGSKIVVLMAQFTILAGIAVVGLLLVAAREPGIQFGTVGSMITTAFKPWELAVTVASMTLVLLAGVAYVLSMGIFSFVIGTTVARLSGLIAVVVFGLLGYISNALGPLAMYVFSFIPNPSIIIHSFTFGPGGAEAATYVRHVIPALPFWPLVLGSVILLLIAGRLLETEVDA